MFVSNLALAMELQASNLTSPQRVETVARARLGMVEPDKLLPEYMAALENNGSQATPEATISGVHQTMIVSTNVPNF